MTAIEIFLQKSTTQMMETSIKENFFEMRRTITHFKTFSSRPVSLKTFSKNIVSRLLDEINTETFL